jgi:RHS repeat-associated protein
VTKTYTYPAPTDPKPHTVTSVTTTDTTGTRTLNYGYDAAGNTTSRLGPAGGVQTLTWDIEGQLASVVEGGDSTNFVYDAGGNRLLRKDAKGTTLFLGAMEVRLDKATNAKTATRYYTHAGQTVAVRTTAGLTWLAQDHHGTGTVTIDEATQTVERRRFTPFGETRGPVPGIWPDSKGFVGGEQDPTGLTHLGARLYDPAMGRFVSVDPVADPMDPQQLQGYSYGNNSPVSVSDPDGLRPMTDEEWYGPTQAQIDAANTPSGGGGDSGPPRKEIDEAKRVKNKSKLDVVLEAGGEILMEVLGINDIRNCVTKGDIMACAMTVANIIPWGKIFKLPKIVKAFKKAYDAVTSFGEKLKWADNVLKRADEAASAAASAAAKQADEAAAAGAKQADDAAAAGAKQADEAGAASRADEAGEAVGDSCSRNSFTPGTRVLMADGTTKPIDQIQVGDQVTATEPTTGTPGPQAVTTTIIGDGVKILVDLTVDTDGASGNATATITATDGHPFWLPEQGVWLKAIDLKPGDALVTPDGTRVTVMAVAVYAAPATVHNLTIATDHTYYVVAGNTPILAHNSGGEFCPIAGASLRDMNPTGGMQNCVRCAIETDRMLAGRLTSGAPAGGPFPIAEITAYSRAPLHQRTVDEIVSTMERFGAGSRGIVVGLRGPAEIGHAFNVVNQRGVVRFLDGQIGGAANLNDGFKSFLVTFTQKGRRR